MLLKILLLLAISPSVLAIPAAVSGRFNPCAEGDFYDILQKQCKTLDKSFGFSWATFDANHKPGTVVNITNCTDNNLRTAFQTIRNAGGGTINLPVCTLTISKRHQIPPNLLLQGMGSDKTIITHGSSYTDGSLFYCKIGDGCKNVVIRDLQIKGGGGTKPGVALYIRGVVNLLYERIRGVSTAGAFIQHAHSSQVTVRYTYVTDATGGSIGSKDCFAPKERNGPPASWKKSDCGNDPLWTNNVTWNSNKSLRGKKAAMAGHISNLEVAGNELGNASSHGIKMPEIAVRTWAHDNYAYGNSNQGMYPKSQACEIAAKEFQSSMQYVYRNRIENNAKSGIQTTYVPNVILKDNILNGNNNGGDQWNANDGCSLPTDYIRGSLFLCGGGATTANGGGNTPVTVLPPSDSRCDLSNVGNVFP